MDIEAPVGHKYTLIWQTGEYESKNRLGIAWLPMCSSPIYHQAAGDETAFFLPVRGQNLWKGNGATVNEYDIYPTIVSNTDNRHIAQFYHGWEKTTAFGGISVE